MNLTTKTIAVALVSVMTICGAQAQKKNITHQKAHRELLANQSKSKLIDKSSFVDFGVNNPTNEPEPELDIYTEGWNSRSVNPYKESQVPDKKVINVTGYHMPVPGKVTSNYGYRPRFGRMHKGVDLALKSNDTVRAAFDGKVRLTNYEAKGYGNYVIIRHPNGLETVYGHLNKHLVKDNQVVKAGDPIGLGGSTGRSTGPHLHFETRYMGYAINPAAIFDFANHTTHTDEYLFTKQTYQNARSYSPSKNQQMASNDKKGNTTYKSSTSTATTYTVKKGDSVASIAKSYGISTTTLRKLNNMASTETIKIGQVLKVK